jgi:ABC-type antimicrobial peptide transport system permease subunit
VSPEYFSVLDLPIIAGRGFTDDEARSRAAVVVITQSAARRLWPGGNAIGQELTIPPTEPEFDFLSRYHVARVIGITRDAVPGSIVANPSTPILYYPQPLDAGVNQLIVRISGSEQRARASIEQLLGALDSSAVVEMHTLSASLALQVYPFRAMFWVSSAVGMIALVLTLIGVYGVISYVVAQRRKEFGIRIALGAASSSLVAVVLRQSMRLAVIGVAVGVTLALGISRLFASMLFNLDTFNVAGYAGAIAVVLVACLLAAYAPSRRAGRVDPLHALRQD